MEQRYGTDPSRGYGTGVWNGGMERVWSRSLFRTSYFDLHPYIYIHTVYRLEVKFQLEKMDKIIMNISKKNCSGWLFPRWHRSSWIRKWLENQFKDKKTNHSKQKCYPLTNHRSQFARAQIMPENGEMCQPHKTNVLRSPKYPKLRV